MSISHYEFVTKTLKKQLPKQHENMGVLMKKNLNLYNTKNKRDSINKINF